MRRSINMLPVFETKDTWKDDDYDGHGGENFPAALVNRVWSLPTECTQSYISILKWKAPSKHLGAYLIFVIFFTRAKFLEKKIYTEKTRKLQQNTQKIANFLRYYVKIHSKLPIFHVKSVKNYTGQSFLHRYRLWCLWQIWGMLYDLYALVHTSYLSQAPQAVPVKKINQCKFLQI